MTFTKEQMMYIYEWDATNFIYGNEATRRLFDPLNGNQVLFLINIFLQTIQINSGKEGYKVENMLMEKLPLGIKSEKSVLQWLESAYTKQPQQW